MDGLDYLCNYYDENDRKNYFYAITEERRITNVADRNRLLGLIILAGKYADEDLNDIDQQKHAEYLQKIEYVNKKIWLHINSVGRPRVAIVRS